MKQNLQPLEEIAINGYTFRGQYEQSQFDGDDILFVTDVLRPQPPQSGWRETVEFTYNPQAQEVTRVLFTERDPETGRGKRYSNISAWNPKITTFTPIYERLVEHIGKR